ncbi:MAG: hypothetical protein WA931_13920, partial [Rhodococcus sp. (in: high G+C Gram-positive bacteria)]
MPAERLPEYQSSFAEDFRLGGAPSEVMASATTFISLADAADQAATALRGFSPDDFVGDEGDAYRDKIDSDLPTWLTRTADAHRTVGNGVRAYGSTFTSCDTTLAPMRAQAPIAHAAVNAAADKVQAAEWALAAAQAKHAQAEVT